MAVLTHKLRASTLLETLIAIVLILICFAIATMVLVNIMQSDNGRLKFHAQTELQAVYLKTIEDKEYIDATIDYEAFHIQKTIEPYRGAPNLYLLKLTATAESKQVLGELKKILLIEK